MDKVMGASANAETGSHRSDEAPSGLRPSGFDPARMSDDDFVSARKVKRAIDVLLTPREMALLFADFHSGEQAEFYDALADEVRSWNGLGWCGQSCDIARVVTARGASVIVKLAEHVAASVDRSPEGQDAEERLDRNNESAVRDSADAPKVQP